jgi:hypothetical protein
VNSNNPLVLLASKFNKFSWRLTQQERIKSLSHLLLLITRSLSTVTPSHRITTASLRLLDNRFEGRASKNSKNLVALLTTMAFRLVSTPAYLGCQHFWSKWCQLEHKHEEIIDVICLCSLNQNKSRLPTFIMFQVIQDVTKLCIKHVNLFFYYYFLLCYNYFSVVLKFWLLLFTYTVSTKYDITVCY